MSPLRPRRLLAVCAFAGTLAVLVTGCGSSSSDVGVRDGIQPKAAGLGKPRYDRRTEAALGDVIRPAMTRAGERIIRFAAGHPKRATKTVHGHVVYLTVRATPRYTAPEGGPAFTRDIMKLATRHTSGEEPDPHSVLAVAVSRFGRYARHPGDDFYGGIALYAPGGVLLPVGEGNSHIAGWSAQERDVAGAASGPTTTPLYDSSGAQLAKGRSLEDPLAAAKIVCAELPNLVAFTETDFRPPGRFGRGRMMP